MTYLGLFEYLFSSWTLGSNGMDPLKAEVSLGEVYHNLRTMRPNSLVSFLFISSPVHPDPLPLTMCG